MTTRIEWKPAELTEIEAARRGADVSHLMPAWDDIPREFQIWRGNAWGRIATEWFFHGIDPTNWSAKPGIDKDAAIRHLGHVLGSFQPAHEHKEAAVAYLLSLWFEPIEESKS